MTSSTAVVDAILTAILQWQVKWLDEQKVFSKPPPICRAQPKRLKITYDSYKDYESTFVPLLMHEIWAQIYDEWTKLEEEIARGVPMDIDGPSATGASSLKNRNSVLIQPRNARQSNLASSSSCQRQFWIGIADYQADKPYQCTIKCQCLVENHKLNSHLKIIGEGDLVRLDLAKQNNSQPTRTQNPTDATKDDSNSEILSLFGYIIDVSSERLDQYTRLAECFVSRSNSRDYNVINYQVVIAKRPLKLNLRRAMKMSGIYYLKPMIRQIESVTVLPETSLASDILCPKKITCQLTVPTVVTIKSRHYNDMQYKAIIGTNEALMRNIPKIQLIQGPPGTGKTHTLIGIIKHFYSHWRPSAGGSIPKILICAPSNGAIDEVGKRLYRDRAFLKETAARRSLRIVRVGHPDHINESVRCISLEELIETNANSKVDNVKKKIDDQIKLNEDEISRCDTEIANRRYTHRQSEIPELEAKIAKLMREIDTIKASEGKKAKREISEAAKRKMRHDLIVNTDIVLTTLNSCQRYPLELLFKGDRATLSFHCVIVDEASQCCEPELLLPLCYKMSKMILIGDPMQLPATVISRFAQDHDFGQSLFERFFIHFGKYDSSSPIAMLTEQYRMHPEISKFPSKHFYDNRLINAAQQQKSYPLTPYLIFDVRYGSESKSNKSSLENEAEASFVRNLLVAVLTKAPPKSSVGVITPYKGQRRLITHKIQDLQSQKDIKVEVNTCDGFQGQEKDIIILSCVRAFEYGGSIGFLKSVQRMNVALTRAKHCLIIIVSAKSLSNDVTWKALIDDAKSRKVLHVFTHTPTIESLMTTIVPDESSRYTSLQNMNLPSSNFSNGIDTEYCLPMDID